MRKGGGRNRQRIFKRAWEMMTISCGDAEETIGAKGEPSS
jgi:hypothetical protein